MKRLTSIVAMNHQGAIGVHNALPWRLKSDLRFFRETTSGNVVIMGRLTFESLGGKPLPHRSNVILSHSYNLLNETPDCVLALGIEEGLLRADRLAGPARDSFVIGGASMYEQFAPYVDRYLITLVDKAVPDADTFVPEWLFGNADDWDIRQLARYSADETNEADFMILELNSLRAAEIAEQRERVIERRASLGRRPFQGAPRRKALPAEARATAALF